MANTKHSSFLLTIFTLYLKYNKLLFSHTQQNLIQKQQKQIEFQLYAKAVHKNNISSTVLPIKQVFEFRVISIQFNGILFLVYSSYVRHALTFLHSSFNFNCNHTR